MDDETQHEEIESQPGLPLGQRLSLVVLVALLAALSIVLVKTIGVFLSIHLVVLAVGILFKLRRTCIAGMTGALFLVISLLAAWVSYGNTDTMRWHWDVRFRCIALSKEIERQADTDGQYPDELEFTEDFIANNNIQFRSINELKIGYGADVVSYEKVDADYHLVWLGDDDATGGTGINADLEFNRSSQAFSSVRLPLSQFLLDAPGSRGLTFLCLMSLAILASTHSQLTESREMQLTWKELTGGLIGAVVVSVFLVGVYIQAGQSGH